MKVNDYLAVLTAIIVAGMMLVTGWSLIGGDMNMDKFLSVWTPVLMLVLGYWFRGSKDAG